MTLSVRVHHRFEGFELEASFEAPEGVTALFGRSGSGKTTLINTVAGLLRPDSGRVEVGGRVLLDSETDRFVRPHKRRLGYVFQDGRLFPHLTVRQNLNYGGWFSGRDARDTLGSVTAMLGLEPLLARKPANLSGGEKQRVAIGRALMSAPDMLLMDEPLAALDQARKAEILPYIQRLKDESGVPILYVSHAMAEIARIATTVVVLDQGRVKRVGPLQEVLSDPETAPLLGLREAGAVLDGVLTAHTEDGLSALQVSGGTLLLPRQADPVGAKLRVRIAAKDVMIATKRPEGLSALNVFPAQVRAVRQGDGPGVVVQLQCGDDLLLARVTRRSAEALALVPGTLCYCVMKSVAVAKQDVG